MKTWNNILNIARSTVGKPETANEPSATWKRKILMAEHSPIRLLILKYTWSLKYWISVHFTRHKIGIEHFVKTQRDDTTGEDRDSKKQSNIVNHTIIVNAQAVINISRKRLCNKAHRETRIKWREFLNSIAQKEPELYSVSVRECVYRNGLCPEIKTCGYNKTEGFKEELKAYLIGFEHQINS